MKWIRRVLAVVVVLVLLVVGAVFLLLEPGVVAAVETGGTRALGVETRLASADVRPFAGHFGLAGLSVDNPEGFAADHFLDLSETTIDVKLASLLSDKVRVPRIVVSGVDLALERNASGSNYGVLLERLQALSKDEEEAPPPEGEPEPGKKVVIDELVLRDVRAEVRLFVIGGERRTVNIALPEITLNNIGGEDGASVDVVWAELVEELLAAVLDAAGDQLPEEFLRDLESGLREYGSERLDEAEQKVRDEIEKTEQKAREELEGALGEDGAKAVEDATKKIGDLLKKKDE